MDIGTITGLTTGGGAVGVGLWRAAKALWDMGGSAGVLAKAVQDNTAATNGLSAKLDGLAATVATHDTRLAVLETAGSPGKPPAEVQR